jgi:hypothetical protein
MAQTPWKAFAKSHPERDDFAVVSYLLLKTFWALPHLGVAEFCVGKRKFRPYRRAWQEAQERLGRDQ